MADNNGDWRASLPPELQANESLTRFKDVGGLVKSYIDMEKFVSSTGRVPKDDSDTESWNSYYKHWGRPEKPEYKLPDLPKEYQLDDAFKGNIQKFAHDMGLNQKQFNQMINWGLQQSQGIFESQQKLRASELNDLKSEWGFRYDTNRDRAHKTVAMLVNYQRDHPFVKWLESTGNDDNPTVLRFFHDLSNRLGEDNFVDEQSRKEAGDRDTAAKRIREIMADTTGPYFKEGDIRHKDAVEEMARLYALAYPEE